MSDCPHNELSIEAIERIAKIINEAAVPEKDRYLWKLDEDGETLLKWIEEKRWVLDPETMVKEINSGRWVPVQQ